MILKSLLFAWIYFRHKTSQASRTGPIHNLDESQSSTLMVLVLSLEPAIGKDAAPHSRIRPQSCADLWSEPASSSHLAPALSPWWCQAFQLRAMRGSQHRAAPSEARASNHPSRGRCVPSKGRGALVYPKVLSWQGRPVTTSPSSEQSSLPILLIGKMESQVGGPASLWLLC